MIPQTTLVFTGFLLVLYTIVPVVSRVTKEWLNRFCLIGCTPRCLLVVVGCLRGALSFLPHRVHPGRLLVAARVPKPPRVPARIFRRRQDA